MKTKEIRLAAPVGMSGKAVAPWTPGEIYAVAADWAQASSPVMIYGEDGWHSSPHQVADFRHNTAAALREVIAEAIEAGGDEADGLNVDAIMADAVDLIDADVYEMAEMLESHGD